MQLFVKGTALPGLFAAKRPEELLESGDWGWHDLSTAVSGPEDSLSVWTWNGKSSRWGTGNSIDVEGDGLTKSRISIATPQRWISAITFLNADNEPQPREMIAHVINHSEAQLKVSSIRFWLPRNGATWQTLFAADPHPVDVQIPPGDRGIVRITAQDPWPLTYAAIELTTDSGSLWEHMRIKTEHFDISGGWIGNMRDEPYLQLPHTCMSIRAISRVFLAIPTTRDCMTAIR